MNAKGNILRRRPKLRRTLHVEQEIGPSPDRDAVRVETHTIARQEREDGTVEEVEREETRDHDSKCPWISTGVRRTVVRRS